MRGVSGPAPGGWHERRRLTAAMYIPKARNAGARVAYFNMEEYFDEPGCVWAGDWMFRGDAAEMVPECLKGIVGNIGSV